MTTFTVWKFDDPEGATRAELTVQAAISEGLLEVVDRLVVSWPEGATQPEVRHSHSRARSSVAWGALWGMVGGAVIAIPVAGALIGAGMGAVAKARRGPDISEDARGRMETEVSPGTSALFLITDRAGHADLERLDERLRGRVGAPVSTSLTAAERQALLETFRSG